MGSCRSLAVERVCGLHDERFEGSAICTSAIGEGWSANRAMRVFMSSGTIVGSPSFSVAMPVFEQCTIACFTNRSR